MNSHETVPKEKRLATPGQVGEVCGALNQCVPGELSFDDAEAIIGNKGLFMGDIRAVFIKHKAIPLVDRIMEKEREYHQAFFGRIFNLSAFEATLRKYGEEKIREWRRLGLEVHFLPPIAMAQDTEFPGWKVRPEDDFYKWMKNGGIRRLWDGCLEVDKEAHYLGGITVLIDTRCKPAYDDGQQMWENDNLLGPIIKSQRDAGEIPTYEHGPQSSRFGISVEPGGDWDKVKPALAMSLGLKADRVRLERTIEANVISQMFLDMPRAKDGHNSTSVWLEEFFLDSSKRLYGGQSSSDDLGYVYWDDSSVRWQIRSVRPLAVL